MAANPPSPNSSPTPPSGTPPQSSLPIPIPPLLNPPQSTPQSPPPETPPPPPSPQTVSPPPPAPQPPSPPADPPSTTSSPPPATSTSPPPPVAVSPSPPVTPSAPPPAVSASPPPPDAVPPTTSSPPPPVARPPKHSPPAPSTSPPPSNTTSPPAPSTSPPPSNTPSPPAPSTSPPPSNTPSPPAPSTSPPPSNTPSPPAPSITPPPSNTPSPPAPSASPPRSNPSSPLAPSTTPPPRPSTNTSTNGDPARTPLPSLPTEKPTARPTPLDSTPRNSGGIGAGGVAAVGSIFGLLALSLVLLAVWQLRKRKRKDKFTLNYGVPSPFASSQNSDSSFLRYQHSAQPAGSASANNYIYSPPDGGIGASRSWFSYQELSGITNGFSSSNLLGEGGFGSVYKGVLADGREVAVKQLKAGSGQGEREFRAEVEIISRIHHRHLVSLVGYCIAENQRLLVYDYVPNNTLHYHLHDQDNHVMEWANRVRVAAGAARGLAYLHEDCQPRIIHRDIKSTNILLDNNFEARVADFGLAKLALELDLHTHVSTRVMGTFGYLSPEYASTGKLTEKSDVFSFGVVLLELITGRKPVDSSQPLGDESLVEWARPLLTQALDREDFGELVDHRLGNNFVASEMFRMIEAAAACVRHLASKRPKMSQIVRALDSMDELADLNNGMKPGQSGIFSSEEHSAQIRMFQRMAFGSQEFSSSNFSYNSQTSRRN